MSEAVISECWRMARWLYREYQINRGTSYGFRGKTPGRSFDQLPETTQQRWYSVASAAMRGGCRAPTNMMADRPEQWVFEDGGKP